MYNSFINRFIYNRALGVSLVESELLPNQKLNIYEYFYNFRCGLLPSRHLVIDSREIF